jgi:hypothetical protein
MEVRPVHGTSDGDKGKRWFFSVYEQWSAIRGGCNWYDFTLIKIQWEYAPYKYGTWELEVGLLGVTVNISYLSAKQQDSEGDQRG